MNPDWHDLIQRHMGGLASEEEAARLHERLACDDDVARLYLRYMSLDVMLEAKASSADAVSTLLTAPPLSEKKRGSSWWRLPPVTAAAAGIVLGAFSATMVWAMASGKMPSVREQAVPLVDGGFEKTKKTQVQGVPRRLGVWAGDPCEIVSEAGNVRPHSGDGMLRFLSADVGRPVEGRQWSGADLWQIVELPGSGQRRVRIRAWFNAETAPRPARFHLVAVAGAGGASSAPELWKGRLTDATQVLASGRTVKATDADPSTWEPADLLLAVPANAHVLVVGLAAYRLDGPPEHGFPAQFADDVSVSITAEDVAP